MSELASEDRLAVARKRYNDVVRDFNVMVRSFPTNIFAGMFNFQPASALEIAKPEGPLFRPLADRQAIQFMIADSAMELHACRLMVYECAWRHDRGEDVRQLSYMTKIMCAEMASRVVDRSIQVHGGVGLTKDLPLEWW